MGQAGPGISHSQPMPVSPQRDTPEHFSLPTQAFIHKGTSLQDDLGNKTLGILRTGVSEGHHMATVGSLSRPDLQPQRQVPGCTTGRMLASQGCPTAGAQAVPPEGSCQDLHSQSSCAGEMSLSCPHALLFLHLFLPSSNVF